MIHHLLDMLFCRISHSNHNTHGYWCMEVYAQDQPGILWPLVIWPYSLEAPGQLSENEQIRRILSWLDEYFGQGFGIHVIDRGGDRINLIEGFLACKRHFIIRQRGDRTVLLENGVRMVLCDLVEPGSSAIDTPDGGLVVRPLFSF